MDSGKRNSLTSVEEKVKQNGERPEYAYKPPNKRERHKKRNSAVEAIKDEGVSNGKDGTIEESARIDDGKTNAREENSKQDDIEKIAESDKPSSPRPKTHKKRERHKKRSSAVEAKKDEGVSNEEEGAIEEAACIDDGKTKAREENGSPLKPNQEAGKHLQASKPPNDDCKNTQAQSENNVPPNQVLNSSAACPAEGFNELLLQKRKSIVESMVTNVIKIQAAEYEKQQEDRERKKLEQAEKAREQDKRLRNLAIRGYLPEANDSVGWQLIKQLEINRAHEKEELKRILKTVSVSSEKKSPHGSVVNGPSNEPKLSPSASPGKSDSGNNSNEPGKITNSTSNDSQGKSGPTVGDGNGKINSNTVSRSNSNVSGKSVTHKTTPKTTLENQENGVSVAGSTTKVPSTPSPQNANS